MRRWEVPGGVRFVTFSCHGRVPLMHNPSIRTLFAERLAVVREAHGLRLFAWVVMPEHVHLLLSPGERPLGEALRSLKTSVARRVVARWRELDASILERVQVADGTARFWLRGGGYDRHVRSEEEFCREVRYIHRNPVERGLVPEPPDWAWSSARWWAGDRRGVVECDPPPGDRRNWAGWKGFM